jgi:hypothetical protein
VANIPYKARSSADADRAGLSDVQAARLAAFQQRIRRKPGLAAALAEVARHARWFIAIDVGLLLAGVATGRAWLVLAGAILLVLTFGLPAWRHRFARWFDRMLQAMALGEWDEAGRLLARFRQRRHPEAVEASLHFHDAQIRARQGEPLQPLLARLELVRVQLSPEDFLARSASVHSAAKDYDGFLACMGAAWEATPHDPSRQVDYALAHARLGDLVRAQKLLDGVDMEALQAQGRPFVWWARGLIELRNGKPAARETLLQGLEGFLKATSPAGWSSLALCSGACALALQRNGDAAGAKTMIGRVWPVLRVHADTRLRAEIDREIGIP